MVNSLVVELFQTSSTKRKKEIIEELSRNTEIRKLIIEHFNPNAENYQIAFAKKQKAKLISQAANNDTFSIDKVKKALNEIKLISSPKVRKERIVNVYSKVLTQSELMFLLALITKDIPVGYRTLASIITELPYHPFQLAQKFTDKKVQKLISEIADNNGYVIIQPKLDGIRIHYNPVTNEWYTRNQEHLNSSKKPNLRHLEKQLQELISQFPELQNVILDGELYAGNWNDTMTYVTNESEVDGSEKLCFYIYDVIDRDKYESYIPGRTKGDVVDDRPQITRVGELIDNTLKDMIEYVDEHIVRVSDNIYFLTPNQYSTSYIQQKAKEFLDKGYEGAMIKIVDTPYVDKRTEAWIKVKPVMEVDAVIVDVLEGDGKHAGKLGSLVCKANINDKEVTFKVGSGFDDEARIHLWNMRDELIGKVVEVQFQELTKENIPRFPVFVRMRPDKESIYETK